MLVNGRVYTVDADQPFAEAVAMGGYYLVRPLTGEQSEATQTFGGWLMREFESQSKENSEPPVADE